MKILVVDDEDLLVKGIRFNLQNDGYEVITGSDGVQAVELARSQDPDLIVLDVMMPKMDGYTFTKTLRAADNNLPILMVSAKQMPADKNKGFAVGTDDYMTKPFSPSELVARVKAHMARYERLIGSAVEENKVIEIRGIKIDTTARRVWVNGEERTFTTVNEAINSLHLSVDALAGVGFRLRLLKNTFLDFGCRYQYNLLSGIECSGEVNFRKANYNTELYKASTNSFSPASSVTPIQYTTEGVGSSKKRVEKVANLTNSFSSINNSALYFNAGIVIRY